MSELDSWEVWLSKETQTMALQLAQMRANNEAISIELAERKQIAASTAQLLDAANEQLQEKEKQIDFLTALVTVRDQEIAQLRQLVSEWKQLVDDEMNDAIPYQVWKARWQTLQK